MPHNLQLKYFPITRQYRLMWGGEYDTSPRYNLLLDSEGRPEDVCTIWPSRHDAVHNLQYQPKTVSIHAVYHQAIVIEAIEYITPERLEVAKVAALEAIKHSQSTSSIECTLVPSE